MQSVQNLQNDPNTFQNQNTEESAEHLKSQLSKLEDEKNALLDYIEEQDLNMSQPNVEKND
jgi:cell division protein FtsB